MCFFGALYRVLPQSKKASFGLMLRMHSYPLSVPSQAQVDTRSFNGHGIVPSQRGRPFAARLLEPYARAPTQVRAHTHTHPHAHKKQSTEFERFRRGHRSRMGHSAKHMYNHVEMSSVRASVQNRMVPSAAAHPFAVWWNLLWSRVSVQQRTEQT